MNIHLLVVDISGFSIDKHISVARNEWKEEKQQQQQPTKKITSIK